MREVPLGTLRTPSVLLPAPFFMNKVNIDPVDRRYEIGELVNPVFLLAPIKFRSPVVTKLLHVVEIGAVVPPSIVRHFMPGEICDPRLYFPDRLVRNVDFVRRDSFHFLIFVVKDE